jgi:predicted GNAT family acetyltransferase
MTELLAPNGKPSNLTPEQYKLVREPAFKKWFGDWINDPENSSKVVDVNGEPMVVYHGTNSEFYIFSEEIERRGFSDYGFFFTSDPIIAESYTLGSNQSVETIKSGEAYGENANIMALFLNIRNPKIIDAQNTEFFRIGYKMEIINVDRIIPTKSLYIQKNDFSNEWLIRDIKYGNTIFESENEELVNKQLQKLKKQKEIIFSDEFEIPSDLSQRGTHINEYVFDLKKSEKHDGLIIKNIKDTGSPLPKIFGHSGIATNFVVKESVQIKSALFNKTFDGNNPDIRFADGGYLRPFTDDGNKLVVYKTKDYKIAVDNVDKARYLTLWFVNSLYDLDVKVGYLALYESEDGFLKVQEIDIQKQHRGKGLSKLMYLMALKYSSDNVKGIKSYLPDRVNKKQIPKIYKKLNAKNDGDWSYILKSDNLNNFKSGGRTISQTPAPKKDQIYGSDKNKEGSAKDTSSAKHIKFSDDVLEKIQNSVDKHNEKHPNKKITIDSAKAVVRRGMGAYSSTHRPTISGGNENSRVAWGLARLNAFMYKIVNGKSKSGKYSQDNDLIEELGYKVQKYEIGGKLENEEFENSALFFGGFFTGIQRQGIGKSIIYDIFENNPKLENILLYTQQDAIGFWQKLGGEIIKQGNDKIGIHRYFIKINRNSLTKSKNIKELGVSYKNIETKVRN